MKEIGINGFSREDAKELGSRLKFGPSIAVGLAARGASCDAYCGTIGARCDAGAMAKVNTCGTMRSITGGQCGACRMSQGDDQPGVQLHHHHREFVSASAANADNVCMVRSAGAPTCHGAHGTMSRGCACVFGR